MTAPLQIVNSFWLDIGCLGIIEIALEDAYACMSMKAFLQKQLNSRKVDSETLFLEINLCLRKWLIVDAYKPLDQSKSVLLESLSKSLSICLDIYENVVLLGNFNKTQKTKISNILQAPLL